MQITRYAVRHFADLAMTQQLETTKVTSNWSEAWNELHCHKRPIPPGLEVSVIEKVEDREPQIVARYNRRISR